MKTFEVYWSMFNRQKKIGQQTINKQFLKVFRQLPCEKKLRKSLPAKAIHILKLQKYLRNITFM